MNARERIEEIKLLSACALADNRQAFGRLVELHTDRVKRFLLNLTRGDESLTDDLAQDTFLKAYMAVRSFHGLSNFSTWLYRIAYNEYLAYCRRRRELPYDELPDIPDQPPAATDDQRLGSVMEAIDRLREPVKAIVLLHYLEDRSVRDIATITGIAPATVKVYLMRGRDRIRKLIANERI